MKLNLSLSGFRTLIIGALFFVSHVQMVFSDGWQQPPEQFSTPPNATQATVGATDGNGNAIAACVGADGTTQASYFSNGVWGPITIFTPSGGGGFPQVAMNSTGTGLILYLFDSTDIVTSFFNNGVWTTPTPNPLDILTNISTRQAIAMNARGQGVGLWNDAGLGTIRSSFFSGGSWSIPTTIGTGINPLSIAYSFNETAVAAWLDSTEAIVVSNYLGGMWQTPISLGNGELGGAVGIDSKGKAIAAWITNTGDVVSATFNGAVWLPSITVSPGPGNSGLSLAMSPRGTAVITWQDSANNGLSSSYNGATWGPILQFGSSLATGISIGAGVSVDNVGNALVVYESVGPTTQILSASLPLGGTWAAPLVVKDNAQGPSAGEPYHSALSSYGRGFAFWTELNFEEELPIAFASAYILPLPPAAISGHVCNNRFVNQSNRINIISWEPSLDPAVVAYNLSRNGVLIAVIPATGPFTFDDASRCKREVDVYTLTSVNALGVESTPITISFR